MITEEDFRRSLHDHVARLLAELHPDPCLIEALRHRQARRTRMLVAGAGMAVIVVAAGATALAQLVPAGRGAGSLPAVASADDGGPAPAATVGDVPLISTGDCAGLTVTAAVQAAGWPTWRMAPGSAHNAITVPGGTLMYLQASGPCVDALMFRTSGNLLQGADPTAAGGSFNGDGVAVVVSHTPARTGRQAIDLLLSCANGPGICNGNPQELAVIDVTVVPPI